MKKIALIEDRYTRQRDFLEKNGFTLDDDVDIIENFVLEKSDKLLEDIISDSFDLDGYDIIISHKSVQTISEDDTNITIIDKLTKFCKEKGKILVLFSGGIDANYHKENYLELNSQTFYSQNLKVFLEAIKSGNENILMLCYGLKWKLNILLNTLEKINNYIENTEMKEVFFEDFIDECDIDDLDNINIHKLETDAMDISIQEIKKYRDAIYTSIQERVIYE